MHQAIHYEYADGSANRYVITPSQLEYIPVKPEESSTGSYSGGEPATVTLTPEQYKKLSALFEQAINTPSIHIQNRVKMSGLIERIAGNEQTQYILLPKSDAVMEIEKVLAEIREK